MGKLNNRSWEITTDERGLNLELDEEATIYSIKYSIKHKVKHDGLSLDEKEIHTLADFIFHMLRTEVNAPLCECGKTLLHTEEGQARVCIYCTKLKCKTVLVESFVCSLD